MEAAITTVIVGVGTVAMLALLAAGTNANQQAAQLTTAIDLANNIHELCDRVPFIKATSTWISNPSPSSISSTLFTTGDLTWLDGVIFNASSSPVGPVDSTLSNISGMSGWSQSVTVKSVDPSNVTSPSSAMAPASPYYDVHSNSPVDPMCSVTVTVDYEGKQLYQTSWIVAR
jgi:hypothetical protein